jgi:hypothetical protein
MFSLLSSSILYAEVSKSNTETQIIEKIAASLFSGQKITAWGENADQKYILGQSTKINAVEYINDARLISIAKKVPQNFPKNAVLITTEYALSEKDDRIVGAFFWQKGRPNLLFLRGRLEKAHIILGREFDKYIEDEL